MFRHIAIAAPALCLLLATPAAAQTAEDCGPLVHDPALSGQPQPEAFPAPFSPRETPQARPICFVTEVGGRIVGYHAEVRPQGRDLLLGLYRDVGIAVVYVPSSDVPPVTVVTCALDGAGGYACRGDLSVTEKVYLEVAFDAATTDYTAFTSVEATGGLFAPERMAAYDTSPEDYRGVIVDFGSPPTTRFILEKVDPAQPAPEALFRLETPVMVADLRRMAEGGAVSVKVELLTGRLSEDGLLSADINTRTLDAANAAYVAGLLWQALAIHDRHARPD